MSAERLGNEVEQRKRTARALGFRLAKRELAAHALECAPDMNGASVEIHVRPFKPQHFATPQAERDCEQIERLVPLACNGIDKGARFI